MNIGVYIWNDSVQHPTHPNWQLVRTFSIWSDAEEYATKHFNYPEGNCILQLTNNICFHNRKSN